jgi:hypothetical protein
MNDSHKIVIRGRRVSRHVEVHVDDASLGAAFDGQLKARFDRAREQIDELESDFDSAGPSGRMGFLPPELNAEMTELSFTLGYAQPHPSLRWGAIAGGAIHHLRCALDNAVYAIARIRVRPLTDKIARNLAFPIVDTKEEWPKVEWRVRPMPDDVFSAIMDLQPFCGGPSILSMLGHFDNMDKHRLPPFGVVALVGAALPTFRNRVGPYPNVTTLASPPILPTPIITFTFPEPQPGAPEVDRLEVKFDLQFFERDSWWPAIESLRGMQRAAEHVVECLRPFYLAATSAQDDQAGDPA